MFQLGGPYLSGSSWICCRLVVLLGLDDDPQLSVANSISEEDFVFSLQALFFYVVNRPFISFLRSLSICNQLLDSVYFL